MKVATQKGVTLIVLVVTIAILLILAMVTINAAFNKDGLIDSTKEFKNMVENAQDQTVQKTNDLLKELESEYDSEI